MANIILKLIPNKWDEKHFFSFIKKSDRCPKDQHFLAHNNKKLEIAAGDFWECFIWSKRELEDKFLYKVIPYTKINPEKLREERKRVNDFNRMLSHIEKFVGEDFEKVVFLPENRPFLQAKVKDKSALAAKYPDFYFLEEPERLLARPPAPKPPKRSGGSGGFRSGGKPFVKKSFGDSRPPYRKYDNSEGAARPKPALNPLYKRFKSS
ncbi:MAG: hypothetical protein JNL74_05675 [Fibrobacteres bacterium]|nr:hypothetical protein [Fibrobacterota bacterium]